MSRMVLSPENTPAFVVVTPFASVEVETEVCAAMRTNALLTESTSPLATALIFLSSRVTAIETGSAETADAVTETPGSRSVKVLVDDVMTCSAVVPANNLMLASCAVLMTALPGAVSTFVAVPAATSEAVP